MKKLLLPALLSLVILAACDSGSNTNNSGNKEEPEALQEAPVFVADSAYKYVEEQVAFGPRVPNTAEHRATLDYLQSKLKQFGATVRLQSFEADAYDGTTLALSNVIASFYPEQKKRILLAAHWDTRHIADKDSTDKTLPIDGANDGASGVGVLLEIARVLGAAAKQPNVGVDIILFDGEDYGRPQDDPVYDGRHWYCLGSQYWANNKHQANYFAFYGVLLDMVGDKDAVFPLEGASLRMAPSIQKKVWTIGNQLGYSQYFKFTEGPEIYDDHIPVNMDATIPMVDIIDLRSATTFFPQHHTHADNMDNISPATLKAVGQTLVQVLYQE